VAANKINCVNSLFDSGRN